MWSSGPAGGDVERRGTVHQCPCGFHYRETCWLTGSPNRFTLSQERKFRNIPRDKMSCFLIKSPGTVLCLVLCYDCTRIKQVHLLYIQQPDITHWLLHGFIWKHSQWRKKIFFNIICSFAESVLRWSPEVKLDYIKFTERVMKTYFFWKVK